MIRVEVIAVAIRLLVILFLVQALSLLTFASAQPAITGARSNATTALVEIALLFVVSVLTWKFSLTLAEMVLSKQDPEVPVVSLSAHDIERVAFRAIGLLFAALAVSGLAYSFAFSAIRIDAAGGWNWGQEMRKAQGTAELARELVQLLIGTCLFLGKSRLGRLVEIIRHGGDVVADDTNEGGDESRTEGSGKAG